MDVHVRESSKRAETSEKNSSAGIIRSDLKDSASESLLSKTKNQIKKRYF